MSKDPVDIDELNHDLDSFTPQPDEEHQFDIEYDFDEEDTNKKVDDLTRLFNRLKSNKVESLFDVVPKIDNLPREKMNIRRWEK